MSNLAYQNTNNLFPKNEFTLQGPLGGAMAGLHTMYGVNELNNQAFLANINKEAEAIKLDEAQKDIPNKDMKRQHEANTLNWALANPELFHESEKNKLATPGLVNKKTMADTGKAEAETAAQQAQTRSYVVNEELANYFGQDGKPVKAPFEMASMYPQIKAKLEAVGVKGLPATYDSNTAHILAQHRISAFQSSETYRRLEAQKLADVAAGQRNDADNKAAAARQATANATAIRQTEISVAGRVKPDVEAEKEIRTALRLGEPLNMDMLYRFRSILEGKSKSFGELKTTTEVARDEAKNKLMMLNPEARKAWLIEKGLPPNTSNDVAINHMMAEVREATLDKEAIATTIKDAVRLTPKVKALADKFGIDTNNRPVVETGTPMVPPAASAAPTTSTPAPSTPTPPHNRGGGMLSIGAQGFPKMTTPTHGERIVIKNDLEYNSLPPGTKFYDQHGNPKTVPMVGGPK